MDLVELNRLTNLYQDHIRIVIKDVQKAKDLGSFWKLVNIIKGSRNTDNSAIKARDGLIFDARDKATTVTECLENQFSPNETDIVLSGLITNRSGEGCNFFVILDSTVVFSQ